jgi:hypothetical protein
VDPNLEPTFVGLLAPALEERDAQRRLDPWGARLEFDRSRRDFSERDRDVLDIFLPQSHGVGYHGAGDSESPARDQNRQLSIR